MITSASPTQHRSQSPYPSKLPFSTKAYDICFERNLEIEQLGPRVRISNEQKGILARGVNNKDVLLLSFDGNLIVDSFRKRYKLPGAISDISLDGGSRLAVRCGEKVHIYEYSSQGSYKKLCQLPEKTFVTDESIGKKGDEYIAARNSGKWSLFKVEKHHSWANFSFRQRRKGSAELKHILDQSPQDSFKSSNNPQGTWNLADDLAFVNTDTGTLITASHSSGADYRQVIACSSHPLAKKRVCLLNMDCQFSARGIHDLRIIETGKESCPFNAAVSTSDSFGFISGSLSRGHTVHEPEIHGLRYEDLGLYFPSDMIYLPEIDCYIVQGLDKKDSSHTAYLCPVGITSNDSPEIFKIPIKIKICSAAFDRETMSLVVADHHSMFAMFKFEER